MGRYFRGPEANDEPFPLEKGPGTTSKYLVPDPVPEVPAEIDPGLRYRTAVSLMVENRGEMRDHVADLSAKLAAGEAGGYAIGTAGGWGLGKLSGPVKRLLGKIGFKRWASVADDVVEAAARAGDDLIPSTCPPALRSRIIVHDKREISLVLHHMSGWSPGERLAAESKLTELTAALTRKTPSIRGGSLKPDYEKVFGPIPKGMDLDHVIDLQLGGADALSNTRPLDSSVNRSLGSQIRALLDQVPDGTIIREFTIVDAPR